MHAASVYPEPGSNSPKRHDLAAVFWFRGFDHSHKSFTGSVPTTLQLSRCAADGTTAYRHNARMMGPVPRPVKPAGAPDGRREAAVRAGSAPPVGSASANGIGRPSDLSIRPDGA